MHGLCEKPHIWEISGITMDHPNLIQLVNMVSPWIEFKIGIYIYIG